MLPKYSTVFFDFDGTLTSSLHTWLESFQYVFSQFGIRISDEEVIARCFYRDFEKVIAEFNLPCAETFRQMLLDKLAATSEKIKLFDGVKEVLTSCAESNIKLAVVSSAPFAIIQKTLSSCNVDLFFDTLVTGDDVANFKPHPESVFLALKRLASKPEETVMIGDSEADIFAAKAAGIKIGLFYPEINKQFYDFQKLQDSQPHFIFHQYDRLHEHLFDLSSKKINP